MNADPLTTAEQAMRDALLAPSGRGDIDGMQHVRAVLAAARPVIAAETLREAADNLDGGRMGRVRVSYGYIAGRLRARATELEGWTHFDYCTALTSGCCSCAPAELEGRTDA